jgi:uncharacterized protein with von Willebrand factor type A (vWA) domain
MDIFSPVILQLIIDLVLLLAVIFLLWRVNTNLKKPLNQSHKEMMNDFKTVMAESQASSDRFLEALEKSRLALKEIALELDLKEKRVKALLEKNGENEASDEKKLSLVSNVDDKYARVAEMIKGGCSQAQAAEATGFTEAEIGLIIDLYRTKNETS